MAEISRLLCEEPVWYFCIRNSLTHYTSNHELLICTSTGYSSLIIPVISRVMSEQQIGTVPFSEHRVDETRVKSPAVTCILKLITWSPSHTTSYSVEKQWNWVPGIRSGPRHDFSNSNSSGMQGISEPVQWHTQLACQNLWRALSPALQDHATAVRYSPLFSFSISIALRKCCLRRGLPKLGKLFFVTTAMLTVS